MVIEANPFERSAINEPPINGRGLEPLLQNPAMTFHPPSILSGYVWFTVPFAFAVAALIHRRLDDAWIRATRRYAVVSWAFLSIGNLFGGMWAYQELGWGGFWGWDPVENASLMPWIAATAYLHSVMIQERRGLLKVWNLYLVLLTYFLTVFGTFLTRSGLIDSVHTFAQSDVGDYFMVALSLLTTFSMALLGWRILDGSLAPGKEAGDAPRGIKNAGPIALVLAIAPAALVLVDPVWAMLACAVLWLGYSPVTIASRIYWGWRARVNDGGRIDHLLSREGVFLLNNMVLLGCVGVVMFGTLGEKISQYFWQQTKYTATWFNTWMVPGGLLLLLLMGIGPLIPWRKATWESFRRNFAIPLVIASLATAGVYFGDLYNIQKLVADTAVPYGEVPLSRLLMDAELSGVYSLIGFFGVFFVAWTMILEFIRGAQVRAKSTKERFFTAMVQLVSKGKRRYGGYLTHLGFAGLFLGFIGTGIKTEKDLTFNGVGDTLSIEDKSLTFKGIRSTENREFSEWFATFEVYQRNDDGTQGKLLGVLEPSRRSYHGANVKMSRVTTEKDELEMFKANVYLALVSFKPGLEQAEVMAHYNPMIVWMWIGGLLLLLGVVLSVWPDPEPFPVFAAARKKKAGPAPAASAVPDVAMRQQD
jgi:cytochrome c-type biogenesis protein CcmF